MVKVKPLSVGEVQRSMDHGPGRNQLPNCLGGSIGAVCRVCVDLTFEIPKETLIS